MSQKDSTDASVWDVVTEETTAPKAPLALKVIRKGKLIRMVRLEPDTTYIGRMAENHVALDDPNASRSHARIMGMGDHFVIEDQQSENGVFVNDQKIQKHTIKLGDKIAIGSHVLEVIEADDSTKTAERESQIEDEQSQEWRMDQTVSMTAEDFHRRVLEKEASGSPKQRGLPTMSFSLEIGETAYGKNVVFDQGRKREKEGEPDFIEIRIHIGKWILEKKVPL